jgi:hypothetical protein
VCFGDVDAWIGYLLLRPPYFTIRERCGRNMAFAGAVACQEKCVVDRDTGRKRAHVDNFATVVEFEYHSLQLPVRDVRKSDA